MIKYNNLSSTRVQYRWRRDKYKTLLEQQRNNLVTGGTSPRLSLCSGNTIESQKVLVRVERCRIIRPVQQSINMLDKSFVQIVMFPIP